jgi:DNA-binding protein H-NS
MPRHAGFKLNDMSMPELLELREQIHAALASKREELQRQVDELSTFDLAGASYVRVGSPGRRTRMAAPSKRANGRAHPLKGRTVAPKYRDPENPSQTWAGRGQAPRWLTAYERQGRKRDDFLIGATEQAPSKGRRRKQA